MFSQRQRRGLIALLSLVINLVLQQKKSLISLLCIFLFIIIPIDIISIFKINFSEQRSFISGLPILTSTFLPIIILLVFLPLINDQIYNSSLIKRIKSTGITPQIYIIVVLSVFTLFSLLIYYIFATISILIFMSTEIIEINYFNLIIMPFLYILIFSTTGLLIGSWKASQIIKGIIVFLIIILFYITGYVFFTPESLDIPYYSAIPWYLLLMINPWGLTMYSFNIAFNASSGMDIYGQVISTLYIVSFAFLLTSITLYKLSNY